MGKTDFHLSRRHALKILGVGALAAGTASRAWAQTAATPPLFMDGHVHITNRVYWEKADLWQPRDAGWDYARARAAGVNCIIDNLGVGLSDDVLKALAAKGGLVGIHGGAAVVGKRYRKGMATHRDKVVEATKSVPNMLGYQPAFPRQPGDHGEYIERFDKEFGETWRARGAWKEIPELEPLIPTADEWAEQVDYVIKTVGADHVAIGLDMAGARSGVPKDAGGYGDILAALKRITTQDNVRKITGENWFRVLDKAKA